MLHGIDRLLTPDLLHALAAMGHGDVITIVDANFPAARCANRLILSPGIDATAMLRAVLSLLPVDDFIPTPILTMQVVGAPDKIPEAVASFHQVAASAGVESGRIKAVERFDFYNIARDSFAIVQTGDCRLYANIAITKGVIAG